MISFIKKHRIPIGFVVINIFIKSVFITTQPISHDEPFTIYHAQFDVDHLIGYLKNYNNPPLFEILLHFWIKLFGISELSVRILPMLFSSFSVLFIYKIGKAFFDDKTAIISSALFTFSIMQIWYAHDCRVYSLFLLLTVSSFYLFFKLLKDGKLSNWQLFGFISLNVLLLYAHYFGAFVWLLEGLIIVIYFIKNKSVLITFIKSCVIGLVLFTPHIFVLFQRFTESAQRGTWLKIPSGLESLYNMIWAFTNAPVVAVTSIVVLVACLIKFLITSKKQIQNPFVKYIMWWFLFPFFFMFFMSYKVPMFLDRYLIFITPALYLLLAVGLSFLLEKKRLYYGAAFILVGAFLFSCTLNPDKKRLVRETVDYIKANKTARTIVLGCSPEFMTNFTYYYNLRYFQAVDQQSEYSMLEEQLKNEQIYFIHRLDSNLMNHVNTFDRIIYLDAGADFSSPDNHIKDDLTNAYKLEKEQFYYELFHVYTFSKK